jgi:hypothetical protein
MKDKYFENLKGFITDTTTGLLYEARPKKDGIVESVKNKLDRRSEKGIKEYGTTLEDNPDGFYRWLRELQEELLDAVLYIEKIKKLK